MTSFRAKTKRAFQKFISQTSSFFIRLFNLNSPTKREVFEALRTTVLDDNEKIYDNADHIILMKEKLKELEEKLRDAEKEIQAEKQQSDDKLEKIAEEIPSLVESLVEEYMNRLYNLGNIKQKIDQT